MERCTVGSIEILGSLYMKPGRRIDLYETEKSDFARLVKFI